MDRREYIIAAGSMLALAGCTGSPPTDTATSSPTESASTTATATDTPAATNTPTETETATETETETPEPGAAAQPYVDEAVGKVEKVVGVVMDYASTPNTQFYQAVTAKTVDFDPSGLQNAVKTANSAISEAEQYDTTAGQEETLSHLSTLTEWFKWYGETMTHSINSYKHTQNALGRYFTEYDISGAESSLQSLNADIGVGKSNLSTLKEHASEISSDTTGAISNLSRGQVQKSTDRVETEISAASTFHSELPRTISGESAYTEGVDHYKDDDYSDAKGKFETARRKFNKVESKMADAPTPRGYSNGVSQLSCFVTHMADAADAAYEAASAGNLDDSERKEYEEKNADAIDSLSDCDLDMSKRPDYY